MGTQHTGPTLAEGEGTALGQFLVAEGLETVAHRAFLIEHGCQYCQGYLLGRPVPIDEWEAAHLAVTGAP